MAGMWWRFEHGPPSLEQLAARLSAGFGLPVDIRGDGPTTGRLTVRTIEARVDVGSRDDGAVEVLLSPFASPFVWTHLEAALTDLGGQYDPRVGGLAHRSAPPAWQTRPWSQIGAWRRFAILHRGLFLRAQMLMSVPLLPFVGVYEKIRERAGSRGRARSPGPEDR